MPIGKGKESHLFKHGHSPFGKPTKMYRIWSGMRNRCGNSKNQAYDDYGGRGIKVCDRWQEFSNFLADMGHPPSDKHTIDRKDNDGDYEPGNCVWSTKKEQANNRRSNRLLEYQGRSQTVQRWSDELKISSTTISMRINQYGWEIGKALNTPVRGWGPGKKLDRGNLH